MFEKVRTLLASQLDLDPDTIFPDTDIIEDLGADSLDVVELIMAIEEEFGILAADENIEGVRTVRQVIEFIEKLK